MAVEAPLVKFKIVILGDESVGKTNILQRFVYDRFDTTYKPTICIDLFSKTRYGKDTTMRLQLWDTVGQERFRSILLTWIKGSSVAVAVIVYDITNRQSFLNTTKWIEEVRKELGTDVIIVLVGNKTDLVDKRQVTVEELDDKAREFGFMFIETSAKAGFNIKPLFEKIYVALLGIDTPSTKQDDMVDNCSSSQEVAKTNDDNSSMMMLDDKNKIRDKEHDDEENDNMDGGKHKGIVEVKGRCECDKRCEDILKRMEDTLKRMEERQEGMFRRLEEHKELVGGQSWYLLDRSELKP